MITEHDTAIGILQEAVTNWQHLLEHEHGLSQVDRERGQKILPALQASLAILRGEAPAPGELTVLEQRVIRMEQQITRLEEDAGIEPCENPTPAEQADYDRGLEGQEKGWRLLEHALTEEGTWVVHSFVRRMDGSRTETTRTAPTREAAVSIFNSGEAELRGLLSGGLEHTKGRDWMRAKSFTLKMYAPGEPVPEREAIASCNDSDAWIIIPLHRGVALHSRQGMYGTPANAIF